MVDGVEELAMDGSRKRRMKDRARKAWYAHHRQVRSARWLGFLRIEGDPGSVRVVDHKGLLEHPSGAPRREG